MQLSRRIAARSALAASLGLLFSVPLAAQEPGANPDAGKEPSMSSAAVSPEAQAVMDRMTTYMRGLKSFSVESHSSRDELLSFGYKLQHNENATLLVQRPNRMRAEVSGDLRNRTFVYDGSKLVLYSADDDAYARMDAPDTIAQLVGGTLDTGVDLPLIDVLYQVGEGTLTDNVRAGVLVGDANIDGVDCDHLAFRQANVDWQLWVEQGTRPLPRKIVITTRYEVGDPQFESRLAWNLKPKIDARSFSFVAPEGAQEIPFDSPVAAAGGGR